MSTIRSQAIVRRVLGGGTIYPPSIPNQQPINQELKDSSIEVCLGFYTEYLQQEIVREMKNKTADATIRTHLLLLDWFRSLLKYFS